MFKINLRQLIRLKYKTSLTNICRVQQNHFPTHTRNYYQTKVLSSKEILESGHQLEKSLNQDKLQSETEKEYLVRIKNDPDHFGTFEAETIEDLDDVKEETYISEAPVRTKAKSTKEYADIIKDLIRKKKIKEAIDIIEVKMLKEDRVKPENYLYNLVLGACGRVGYTKKAFSMYNDMKRRDLKITPGTYTALFNACANSPWPEDGLSRTKHLHDIIIEKRYEPNDSNYNAMIKAYGRCGDLVSAFAIVDEMINKGIMIKDDTLNFLLQACITDKEAGFRHGLLVWRKFVEKNIQPTIFTYNLLLRCVRDCGLGDLEVTRDVIEKILPEDDKFLQIDKGIEENLEFVEEENTSKTQNNECKRMEFEVLNDKEFVTLEKEFLIDEIRDVNGQFESGNEGPNDKNILSENIELVENKILVDNKTEFKKPNVFELTENRPNLMAEIPHLGNIISLSEIKRAEDRLLLIGGLKNFLQNMLDHNCTPDIKTYSQLLDCAPNSLISEKEILAHMKKQKIKPDLDFYNMLIKRRSMRVDYQASREVLDLIKKANFQPNLITYGVLALGCKNKEEAEDLLTEMKNCNYRLNAEILGAMLRQGCYHYNFPYVIEIMDICLREEVSPNKKFMEYLEDFQRKCIYGKNEGIEIKRSKSFQKGFQIFTMKYNTWREKVQVEEDVHPWQQFRQPTQTDTRHYKDKETKFKARHTSLFRQKATPTTEVKKTEKKKTWRVKREKQIEG